MSNLLEVSSVHSLRPGLAVMDICKYNSVVFAHVIAFLIAKDIACVALMMTSRMFHVIAFLILLLHHSLEVQERNKLRK